MAIYVDGLVNYRYDNIKKIARGCGLEWCHMATDGEIEELHKFTASIGLKRSWFQDHKTLPHYDIVGSKRILAIGKGAISVSATELVKKCSKLFKGEK